jgi:hypothetical protein
MPRLVERRLGKVGEDAVGDLVRRVTADVDLVAALQRRDQGAAFELGLAHHHAVRGAPGVGVVAHAGRLRRHEHDLSAGS